MKAMLKMTAHGFLMSLVVFGLLAAAAHAQPGKGKKYAFKIDKRQISFATPAIDLPAGKIVVGGEVREVEVSGGKGDCYTLTVTTYRLTPNGEKVPVRSRSKKVCLAERLPEIVVDRIPKGKYLVEIEIDRTQIGEGRLAGELIVTVQPETIGSR